MRFTTLSNYHLINWLIDDAMFVCLLDELILGFCYSDFDMGNRWISTRIDYTLVLKANRLTKCASHPRMCSSLSSSTWRLTLSSYSCSYSSPPDPFWHSFLSLALALEELILIFFLCCTYSSSSLSESDNGSELALQSSDCLPFLSLFALALALEGLFSTILLVRFSNWDLSISAKSWKLLFMHVCKSDCSCCFWLEHAF